jgi:fatty acid/phospholipid biosynthesis enzyme
VRTEHLVQFAYMGAALASVVLGVADPRVALLSNGEEPTRGSAMVQEAHARLAEASGLRFIGNIEGTQVTSGAADVVVADGFTGNVALKVMEGTSRTVLDGVRAAAESSARGRPAACSCGRRCARCATSSTRSARAAPTCSACGALASSRTAASGGRASPTPSSWRPAG